MSDERGGRYFREARFFLAGDRTVAQSHILEARQLMGYMRDQLAMGGPPIQVQYAQLPDGTLIKATMMNGQFQAEIVASSIPDVAPIELDYWPIVVRSSLDSAYRVAKYIDGCGVVAKEDPNPKFGRRYWCGHNKVIFTTAATSIDPGDVWMRSGTAPAVLIGESAVVGAVVGFTEYGGQVFIVKVSQVQVQIDPPYDTREFTRYTYSVYTLSDNTLTLVHTCAPVDNALARGSSTSTDVSFNEDGNVGLAVGNALTVFMTYNQQLLQISISGDVTTGFSISDSRLAALDGFDLGEVTVASRIDAIPDYHSCTRTAFAVGFRGNTTVMLVRELFAEAGHVDVFPKDRVRNDTDIYEVVGGAVGVVLSHSTFTIVPGHPPYGHYAERVHDYAYVMSCDLRIGAYTLVTQSGVTFTPPDVDNPFWPYFISYAPAAQVHVTYILAGVRHDVYTHDLGGEAALDRLPFELNPYYNPYFMKIPFVQSVPHTYPDGTTAIHPSGLFFSPADVANIWGYFSNTGGIKLLCGADVVDVTEELTNGSGDYVANRYSTFGVR